MDIPGTEGIGGNYTASGDIVHVHICRNKWELHSRKGYSTRAYLQRE